MGNININMYINLIYIFMICIERVFEDRCDYLINQMSVGLLYLKKKV